MRPRRSLGALLGALLLTVGCSAPGSWSESRLADLLDTFPASVAAGWGVGASVQATALASVGVSVSPVVANRWGYDDRVIFGFWEEYQVGFPWTWDVRWRTNVEPPPADEPFWSDSLRLNYRWQRMVDAPGGEGYDVDRQWEPNLVWYRRHPPVIRESFGAFVVPQRRGWVTFEDERRQAGDPDPIDSLGSAERSTLWSMSAERIPASRAWDLFEADLFVGIFGVRLGVRPVEFVDFVAGIFLLDPLGDDLPEASSAVLPDATISPT